MRIECPILSLISVLALLVGLILGATITIPSVEISVSATPATITISCDPVFVLVTDSLPGNGMCIGNTVWLNRNTILYGYPEGAWRRVYAHELRHVEQFRALGLFAFIAPRSLLEPQTIDWSDASIELAQMWAPPAWWPNLWTFLGISIKR